ncbi:MAG: hypothetical protein U9N40_00255 [Euryarchaeota archaeon]|nr:hypothetical protein [Euryarchaeota archaeon]
MSTKYVQTTYNRRAGLNYTGGSCFVTVYGSGMFSGWPIDSSWVIDGLFMGDSLNPVCDYSHTSSIIRDSLLSGVG